MQLQVLIKMGFDRSCGIVKDIEAPTRTKAVRTTQRFKPGPMGCMHL